MPYKFGNYKRDCEIVNDLVQRYYLGTSYDVLDYEFDDILKKIASFEAKHKEETLWYSPTRVNVYDSPTRVSHKVPMYSLKDSARTEDIEQFRYDLIWLVKKYGSSVSVEHKVDGLPLRAIYRENCGVLTLVDVVTKGSGYDGERVTRNAMQIVDLPLILPLCTDLSLLEVNCECYLTLAQFEEINKEREREQKRGYQNIPNAVSGILHLEDPIKVKEARLRVFAFDVSRSIPKTPYVFPDGSTLDDDAVHPACIHNGSRTEWLDYLAGIEFPVVKHKKCNTQEEVTTEIFKIRNERDGLSLLYWIDGVIVKADNLCVEAKETNARLARVTSPTRFQKDALAYIFPADEREVVIKDICLKTGRTGVVTPVAIFDPVRLDGTFVSRVSLHNNLFISLKNINIGDTISVHKAGGLIPEIKQVVEKKSEGAFDMFSCSCPSCGSKLVKRNMDAVCTDMNCQAQLANRIINWCGCLNMELDPFDVNEMVENEWLHSPLDLYSLKNVEAELSASESFGLRVKKILESIEDSKRQSADRLLKAFGIEGVGRVAAKELLAANGSITAMAKVTKVSKLITSRVSAMTAARLFEYFTKKETVQFVSELEKLGFQLREPFNAPDKQLAGLTFAITGKFNNSREQMKDYIKANGGRVVGSVTPKTDFLLKGVGGGEKFGKAKELNIEIISYEDLQRMAEGEAF